MPVVPFRIEKEYRDILKSLADKYNTNINQLVTQIIKSYLEEKGHVKLEPKFYV